MGVKDYWRWYVRKKLAGGQRKYAAVIGGVAAVVLGAFLLVEHALVWGGFDPIWLDPLGHEWVGLYVLLAGAGVLVWARWDKSTYVKKWREMNAEAEEEG